MREKKDRSRPIRKNQTVREIRLPRGVSLEFVGEWALPGRSIPFRALKIYRKGG